MKQKILKIITSLMLIMTLTMTNVLLLCSNAIAYTRETINSDKSTNHKNIEFMTYLKNEKGQEITETDIPLNSQNVKIYFKISVKKQGYFNGNIIIKKANFKFNITTSNENISKIEENIIYLNQISAGETKEIEVAIDIIKDDEFDLDLLNMQSKIELNGVYRDSTQKDIKISGQKKININLISSNNKSNILWQDVITNRVLNYDAEEKRVIQIKVETQLDGNAFPTKLVSLNINTPKISEKFPETVLVNSIDKMVANGEKISEKDWKYDSATGKLSINIKNEIKNNKVKWLKDGKNSLIITYIFDKDAKIIEQGIETNAKIELYDNNTIVESSNIVKLKEEKDSIITANIKQKEQSIYKGKLYSNISRDITNTTEINVNLNKVADEISIISENDKIEDENIEVIYKDTAVNKENIESVLGNRWILKIINADTNQIINEISEKSEVNESGDIIIKYPDGVKTIKINTSAPIEIGRINIVNTKTIKEISRSNLEKNNIKSIIRGIYNSNNIENLISENETNIELKETETSAKLEINKRELSTMITNENVEFRAILETQNENNELYKNATIKIELPEDIEKIEIKSIDLLYEDELTVKTTVVKKNIIEISLEGEQTKYKEQAIEGVILIINTNLTINPKATSNTNVVKLIYQNENAINYKNGENIGQEIKNINIVSYVGVVTVNQITEYGLDVINNRGVKSAKLEIASEAKNVTIEKKIINNKENAISDVKILGTFPTKGAIENANNIDISINSEIKIDGIEASRIKIYYSENEKATENLEDLSNKWTEKIEDYKNVKKYLVIIEKLDILEEINLSYEISIPSNLEYNESTEEGYNVYYKDIITKTAESVQLDNLSLTTGKGAKIETELKAIVGENESNEVKIGETLKYAINISNTGSEDIQNIKVLGNIPNGTTYIDSAGKEDKTKKEIEFNIEGLVQGETKTLYYQVRVNSGSKIDNDITLKYGEIIKKSNNVETKVNKTNSEILVTINSEDDEGTVLSAYLYRYTVMVKNNSSKDIKNVKINIKADDGFNIRRLSYLQEDNINFEETEKNYVEIDKIKAGETFMLSIHSEIKAFFDAEQKTINVLAEVIEDNKTYTSNQLNLIAKSVDMNLEINTNKSDYVKSGEIIEYRTKIRNNGSIPINNIEIQNKISNETSFIEVQKNGDKLNEAEYTIDENNINFRTNLNSNEEAEYVTKVFVEKIPDNEDAMEISSLTAVSVNNIKLKEQLIKHILEPENKNDIKNEEVLSDSDNNENEENENKNENDLKKVITGIAWLDTNSNGQKDEEEQLLSGVVVKLLDTSKNEFVKNSNGEDIKTTTNNEGFYSLNNISKGEYLVIFEYDTSKYILTTYNKKGVDEQKSSKAIIKNLTINKEEKSVGCTEIIKIDSKNIANINIGLQEAKIYDLKLDKYISKVTIQNSKGTVTKEYNNETLAKAEVNAKLVNGTTVVVEYKIKVTNEGEIDSYVKKIADYLSSDYKFSSELNKDWYQSGNAVYSTNLANSKLAPGESKELTLIVTKKMAENNMGLITNTAEIVESYNELGLADKDSIEGNKIKSEDDTGVADLIISISTGEIATTIILVIMAISIIGVITYIIIKRTSHRKII